MPSMKIITTIGNGAKYNISNVELKSKYVQNNSRTYGPIVIYKQW